MKLKQDIVNLVNILSALSLKRNVQLAGVALSSFLVAILDVVTLAVVQIMLKLIGSGIGSTTPLLDGGDSPMTMFLAPFAEMSRENIPVFILYSVVFIILSGILKIFYADLSCRVCALASADISCLIYYWIISNGLPWNMQTNNSDKLSYLTRDVDRLYFSLNSLVLLPVSIATVTGLYAYTFIAFPIASLLVFGLFTVLFTAIFAITTPAKRRLGLRLADSYRNLIDIATDSFAMIRDVLIDSLQGFYLRLFRQHSTSIRLSTAGNQHYLNLTKTIGEPVFLAAFIVLIVYASQSKSSVISPNAIALMFVAAGKSIVPMQQISNSISGIQSNSSSIGVISNVVHSVDRHRCNKLLSNLDKDGLSELSDTSSNHQPNRPLQDRTIIQLHKVSYVVKNQRILHSINLSFTSGEFVLITGASGSGKSTLLDLCMGLIRPTDGTVFFRGTDLSKIALSSYYNTISHVPQSPSMFNASLIDNVILDRAYDKGLFERTISVACLEGVVETFDASDSLSTGIRCSNLSGGQRQRLSIARALYKSPSILFLDEHNSALDIATDKQVLRRIRDAYPGMTILCISHRDYVSDYADKIIEIHRGTARII